MKKHTPSIENALDTGTFFDLNPINDPFSPNSKSKTLEHSSRFPSKSENENPQKSMKNKEN